MQSSPDNHLVHPALTSFADECWATLARLTLYVGALALLGILSLHGWDQFRRGPTNEAAVEAGFSKAVRSRPAFAVTTPDLPEKSEVYDIFRHPSGGRKDVVRWGLPGEKPVAELEIYRPGREFNASQPIAPDIAARMPPGEPRELEPAGTIASKFGPVALLRVRGSQDGANSCLGFFKRFGDPTLQISGWSCQAATLPARRAAIACMLNRLTLLASGNEPRLAELFAHAELNRAGCTSALASSSDWVTGLESPRLRGAL